MISVTLPSDDWEAVVTSMDWSLPKLGDHTPGADAVRAHSEACFRARRTIQAAIGVTE